MQTTLRLGLAAAAAALLTGPAFAQQAAPMPHDMSGMSHPMPGMAGAQASPAGTAMMAGMTKMQKDMENAPMSGDPDKDFVAMMIPHHQGAVDMARIELQYGKDPEIRRLAEAIVAAQNQELGQMTNWQTKAAAK